MIGIIDVGGGMRGIFGAPRAVRPAVIFTVLAVFPFLYITLKSFACGCYFTEISILYTNRIFTFWVSRKYFGGFV